MSLLAVAAGAAADAAAVTTSTSGVTTRVSVSSSGEQTVFPSVGSSVSADGRFVAFTSSAPDLVEGDTNAAHDVFVHDRLTASTEIVSVSSEGDQGDDLSLVAAISADGRYVLFWSAAQNLASNDTFGGGDVFVRDRQAGITRLVSVALPGQPGRGFNDIRAWSISADGRYVVFSTMSPAFVEDDTNDAGDVFVRDMEAGITQRVSLTSTGAEVGRRSWYGAISADGRYVGFSSNASRLVDSDTNKTSDVFVRNLRTGVTRRVSVSSAGHQTNRACGFGSISADGRFVAFTSYASNLVSRDTNGMDDVFVRDRVRGITRRVSISNTGDQANDNSYIQEVGAVSSDGRFVAFMSNASNLVKGDTNGESDVFVRDRKERVTLRISVSGSGAQENLGSRSGSISADGRFVVFNSAASNLVSGDTNEAVDVFLRELRPE